jgi:enoyl-CoA hydratase/carnithine racemase
MSALKLSFAGDGIAVVTLANPPINAMDAAVLEKLANLFEGLAADRAVRAAVIAADGPAFSAGLNLKTTPGLDRLGQRRLVDALNDCFGTLYAWPKPLVAAVNGHAIAGGLILALCADWRIVADVPLQISLAEVRVGVTYPVAPLAIARSELAPSVARRLILLGETVDAAMAEALAIMDERVSAEVLLARAIAQAERHAMLPSQAFATTKRELRAAELERIDAARAGRGEPRLAAWLGEEMRRASAAVLRASSAVLRGAA